MHCTPTAKEGRKRASLSQGREGGVDTGRTRKAGTAQAVVNSRVDCPHDTDFPRHVYYPSSVAGLVCVALSDAVRLYAPLVFSACTARVSTHPALHALKDPVCGCTGALFLVYGGLDHASCRVHAAMFAEARPGRRAAARTACPRPTHAAGGQSVTRRRGSQSRGGGAVSHAAGGQSSHAAGGGGGFRSDGSGGMPQAYAPPVCRRRYAAGGLESLSDLGGRGRAGCASDGGVADGGALRRHPRRHRRPAPPCGFASGCSSLWPPPRLRPPQPPPLSASAPLSLAPVPRLAGAVAPYGTTGREWQGRFL